MATSLINQKNLRKAGWVPFPISNRKEAREEGEGGEKNNRRIPAREAGVSRPSTSRRKETKQKRKRGERVLTRPASGPEKKGVGCVGRLGGLQKKKKQTRKKSRQKYQSGPTGGGLTRFAPTMGGVLVKGDDTRDRRCRPGRAFSRGVLGEPKFLQTGREKTLGKPAKKGESDEQKHRNEAEAG